MPLPDGSSLASEKDDYFLVLRPLSQGFLYVFQVDSLGKMTWLFPENATTPFSSGVNPVVPRRVLQVPSADSKQVLFLDRTPGIEHIYAVFSAMRWPELEEALARPGGTHPQAGGADSLTAIGTTPVESPNGLQVRGVGGTHEATTGLANTFTVERNDAKQKWSLPVAPPPWAATGSFLVVERWFRHVE